MDWRIIFERWENGKPLAIGQRLGVPFMRTLSPTLDIKISSEATGHVLEIISVRQDGMGSEGISGVVWDAGLYMVDFLCSCHTNVQESILAGDASPLHLNLSSVIDIGCGTGVCGLAVAKMGARNVLLTDGVFTDSLTVNLSQLSEEQLSGTRTIEWLWSVENSLPAEFELAEGGRWGTILCSDVLYDSKCLDSLQAVLRRLRFERLLISYKMRHPVAEKAFLEQLELWCEVVVIPHELITPLNLQSNPVTDALYIISATPKDKVKSLCG